MYFIGFFVYIFGVLGLMYFKGVPFSYLANPAAIFIVFMAVVGAIAATSGFKTFVSGINAIVSKEYVISDEDKEKAVSLFKLLSKTALLSMFIGLVVSLVATLAYADDLERFAHALAAAMMPLLFGFFLASAVFEPAAYALKNRKPALEVKAAKAYSKQAGDRLLELCLQNGMTEEDIRNATGITLKQD